MKILLAEDDPTLRGELSSFLRAEGHAVDAAADGSDAIRRIESKTYDLVLLDWKMPGATGGEVVQKAKAGQPRTAVIVMTGYASVDAAVEALRFGARDFIQKPFELEALQRTMQSIRAELESRRKEERHAAKGAGTRTGLPPDMKAAFLHTKAGLLIASKVRAGEKTGDEDLLVATLDIIQNFMRVAFPMLRGKRLRAIVQGDHTLVTERGRLSYLTVVIRGEETPDLRRRMRDALRRFERTAAASLGPGGIVEAPPGATELLSQLLELPIRS